MSRRHNDLNVLCLSAEMLGPEMQEKVIRTWLATPFEGGRHARRVAKIASLEAECGARGELEKPAAG
jgi:ribose 5-phosphate isomerase B